MSFARPCAAIRWHLTSAARTSTRTYATRPKIEVDEATNPILAQYLRRKRADSSSNPEETQLPERGTLAPSSIFNDVDNIPSYTSSTSFEAKPVERNPIAMAARLDPEPEQRRRWDRKMVIREVHKRGRLSKTQVIKRTERELVARSEYWKTSMKKLQPLANQIAGKSIEDAIVQMDFSKKKVAARIHDHLVEARNKAIVERGMGLGGAEGTAGEPLTIRLKDGKKHHIMDKTGIYVDQAWVGKGPYGKDRESRAYGRTNILWLPQTSV